MASEGDFLPLSGGLGLRPLPLPAAPCLGSLGASSRWPGRSWGVGGSPETQPPASEAAPPAGPRLGPSALPSPPRAEHVRRRDLVGCGAPGAPASSPKMKVPWAFSWDAGFWERAVAGTLSPKGAIKMLSPYF